MGFALSFLSNHTDLMALLATYTSQTYGSLAPLRAKGPLRVRQIVDAIGITGRRGLAK